MAGPSPGWQTGGVNAQRVATGVGLAGLAALVVSVGVPTLIPPEPVDEIEVGATLDQAPGSNLPGLSGGLDDPFDDPSGEDGRGPDAGGDTSGSGDGSLDSADDPADSPDDPEGDSDD